MLLETKDIQTLFSYIKDLHPHCPPDKIPRLTNAVANLWINSLCGYSMEQLFRAADAHARSCRFWPSLSEIMAQLPSVSESERMRYAPPGPAATEHMKRAGEWQKEWHDELRGHGLPSLHEAMQSGIEVAQWLKMLEVAGVWR